MSPITRKWVEPWKCFRHRLTMKLFGNRLGVQKHTTHFGPKARIQGFFKRGDQDYLALEARFQQPVPPPPLYHDLLDAAARVGHIEERIGYTFKDKMLCIEALKLTSSLMPLYFKGAIHQIGKNKRLALLGDRVLKLALCEIWFQTRNTLADYGKMTYGSESRAVLFARGHALGIHKNLLLPQRLGTPASGDQVAETLEAILGAVYLDSGKSVEIIKDVITHAALDTHKFLKANVQSQETQEKKDRFNLRILERYNLEEQARAAAGKPRRSFESVVASLARKLTAEGGNGQIQEGLTTTEAQTQNESSETAQNQARSEDNIALTHPKASKGRADFMIPYFDHSVPQEEWERLGINEQKIQVPNKEAQSKSSDQAPDSKSRRYADRDASRLSKEGNLRDTPLSSQEILPEEELAGLHPLDRERMLRTWKNAKKERDLMKTKGVDVDLREVYEQKKRSNKKARKEIRAEKLRLVRKNRRRKDAVAQLQPSEETAQMLSSLLPEPPAMTVRRTDSVQENLVPASTTTEQKRSPVMGSDGSETPPSTMLVPTQELSGPSKKTYPSGLNVSQHETPPAPMSGNNETDTSPSIASAPVQKLSSSPEQPSPTKETWTASKKRDRARREPSKALEDIGFARASTTGWDDNKEIVVRTKDAEELENDIINSHSDTWQARVTEDPSCKPSKRDYKHVAKSRRSMRNSVILAEQLTGHAPTNRTATREEYAGPKDQMQKDTHQPFVRFDFYESDTERFMANMTKEDSKAPDAPRAESEKKYTLYTPSLYRESTR